MGDPSDSVKETAKDYAKEGVEKVKHVASAATDAATEEMHKELDDPQPQTGAGSKKGVKSSNSSGGKPTGTSGNNVKGSSSKASSSQAAKS